MELSPSKNIKIIEPIGQFISIFMILLALLAIFSVTFEWIPKLSSLAKRLLYLSGYLILLFKFVSIFLARNFVWIKRKGFSIKLGDSKPYHFKYLDIRQIELQAENLVFTKSNGEVFYLLRGNAASDQIQKSITKIRARLNP